jgi:hypothetical protein
MLRTMKTTAEFQPCIFPFYETYNSLKVLYDIDLKQSSYTIPAQTLYRGTPLRDGDVNRLKPGTFIEVLGFMSTSKNSEKALEFCDQNRYLFVIEVPNLVI